MHLCSCEIEGGSETSCVSWRTWHPPTSLTQKGARMVWWREGNSIQPHPMYLCTQSHTDDCFDWKDTIFISRWGKPSLKLKPDKSAPKDRYWASPTPALFWARPTCREQQILQRYFKRKIWMFSVLFWQLSALRVLVYPQDKHSLPAPHAILLKKRSPNDSISPTSPPRLRPHAVFHSVAKLSTFDSTNNAIIPATERNYLPKGKSVNTTKESKSQPCSHSRSGQGSRWSHGPAVQCDVLPLMWLVCARPPQQPGLTQHVWNLLPEQGTCLVYLTSVIIPICTYSSDLQVKTHIFVKCILKPYICAWGLFQCLLFPPFNYTLKPISFVQYLIWDLILT